MRKKGDDIKEVQYDKTGSIINPLGPPFDLVSCRITVTFRVKQQNLTPRIQQTKSLIMTCYILRNSDALKCSEDSALKVHQLHVTLTQTQHNLFVIT